MPLNSFPSTVSEETLKLKVQTVSFLDVPVAHNLYMIGPIFLCFKLTIACFTIRWMQLGINYMWM
jgi:hypothetical protein